VIAFAPIQVDALFLDRSTQLGNFSFILSLQGNHTIEVPWNCSGCATTHVVLTLTGIVPGTNYVISTYPLGERGLPVWSISFIVLLLAAIIVIALMYTYRRQMSGYVQQKDESSTTTTDNASEEAEEIEMSEITEQTSP